ncbi:MAG: transglutaminase domain-containing protein [Lachnospiraceae bacterium]|nr:transglutaminase domain-containing protein [Lachnospiraceae bacterium]
MKTIRKYWSMKKTIALLLVITITGVYVIGDKFSSVTITKDKNTQVSMGTQDTYNIKPISELNLAETDTGIGKAGESLKDGYEELAACKNKKDFDTSMKGFTQLVSLLKSKTIEELAATDNGTEEYNNYRLAVLSDFEELEDCISGQNEKNYETVIEEIGNIVAPKKQHIPLAGDLPFNNVSVDEIEMEAYTEKDSTAYEIQNESYSNSDLEFTNDVVVNDKIRSEFSELSGVLEVYQYIKNNYMPEFYYGSRKGSLGAFEEKAGNDYDLSSLLLAVLRDREIPAHYVRGEIEITAEQAIKWTAADNINAALRMLSALGIPVTGLMKDADIVAVRLEHVWV